MTTPRPTPAAACVHPKLRSTRCVDDFKLTVRHECASCGVRFEPLASALPAAPVEPEPEPRGGGAVKPCPFCGSPAAPWADSLISCTKAGCVLFQSDVELAAWNTRPIESCLERELGEARETNTKLHRRCQSAEAGLAAKLDAGTGPCGKTRTLGRALANSAATMYREQFEEVRQERDAARSALDEAEKRAAYISGYLGLPDPGGEIDAIHALRVRASDAEERLTAAEREAEQAFRAGYLASDPNETPAQLQCAWDAYRQRALAAPGAKEEAT